MNRLSDPNGLRGTASPVTGRGSRDDSIEVLRVTLRLFQRLLSAGEREEFEELLNGYQTEVKPQGAIQQTLFDELVGAAWNLRRVRRMEASFALTLRTMKNSKGSWIASPATKPASSARSTAA